MAAITEEVVRRNEPARQAGDGDYLLTMQASQVAPAFSTSCSRTSKRPMSREMTASWRLSRGVSDSSGDRSRLDPCCEFPDHGGVHATALRRPSAARLPPAASGGSPLHEVHEDTVETLRMDEADQGAPRARPPDRIDHDVPGAFEASERGIDVRDLERNVMQPRPSRGDESRNGALVLLRRPGAARAASVAPLDAALPSRCRLIGPST